MTGDFSKELKKYAGKWIAFIEPGKEIVGSGNDMAEAKRKAESNGYKDLVFFKVLPLKMGYAPLA